MAEKHANIEELVYDDHNFNQHTAEGMELLEKSIRENKFGRSILIDKDNRIIAGNGIVEAATKTGTKKIRVIETDGDELIAVKRKDLSLDSQEGRRLALADNATSAANLKWDEKELAEAVEAFGITPDDWDVEIKAIAQSLPQTPTSTFQQGLPPELMGVDITPDKLPKIEGKDETPMDRVIIVFPTDDAPKVAALLKLAKLEKVVYRLEEILGE